MDAARKDTLNGIYFNAFYQQTYLDAARIHTESQPITGSLRQWRFKSDPEAQGEANGYGRVDFDDTAWRTTDSAVDTWSALDLHNYMGHAWYRQSIALPEIPADKKVYLWLSATDGSARVFINGRHVPWVNAKGESVDEFVGYCAPASFDITDVIKPGEPNVIAIHCERRFINELGTGGLLGPALVYRDK